MNKGIQGRRGISTEIKEVIDDILTENATKIKFMDEFSIFDNIHNKYNYTINEGHLNQIVEYIEAMNVLRKYTLMSCASGTGYSERSIPFISQPGLRFRRCEFFVEQIMSHPRVKKLDLSNNDISILKTAMIDVIRGKILDEIVIFEAMECASPNHQVFQFMNNHINGEFDMVIRNDDENISTLYEVKLSNACVEQQARHIRNDDMIDSYTYYFGDIADRVILYRGDDHIAEDGVRWQNVESFLINMAQEFPVVSRDMNDPERACPSFH